MGLFVWGDGGGGGGGEGGRGNGYLDAIDMGGEGKRERERDGCLRGGIKVAFKGKGWAYVEGKVLMRHYSNESFM